LLTEQARTFSKVCDISATNFRRQIAALKSPRALQKTEEIQHIGESGRKGGYRPAASVATPQWRIRRDARLRGVAQYRSSTSAFRRQWNSLVLPSFFVPKGEPQRRTRQQHWRDRFEGAPGQKTDRDCQGATLAGRHPQSRTATGLRANAGARCGYSGDIEHHRRLNTLRRVANSGWSLPPPPLVPIRRSAARPESEASTPLSASGKELASGASAKNLFSLAAIRQKREEADATRSEAVGRSRHRPLPPRAWRYMSDCRGAKSLRASWKPVPARRANSSP